MRAAILAESHRPLVIDEVTLPEHLEVGQVLVRVHYSGICGSQLGEIDAVKGPDRYLPHLLGHEGCGTVISTGAGVRRVAAGDRVVLHWRKAGGIESAPPRYRWRGRELNAGWVATFNEYAVVSENRVTPIAAEIDDSLASLLGCPVTTGLGVVLREAAVRPGESVVILGAGGVGLSEVMAAALVSADPIIVVDRSEEKLELAHPLGASEIVPTRPGWEAIVAALVPGGADAVFENTGNDELIQAACRLTSSVGRTILVGVPQRPTTLDTLPLHFGQRWQGSHGGGTDPDVDIPRYLQLYRSGRLPLAALATERCTLDGINEAIARMRRSEVLGRCLVELS